MAHFRQWLFRLLSTLRNGRAETELFREVESHLALLEDEYLAKGMTPADARLAARRAFGGVDQVKEHQRDARSFRWLEDVPRDCMYAMRSLRRTPAFTAAAILTLAVGIGTTTGIYSIVDRVLLQPLPYPNADRLVRITEPERPLSMQSFTFSEYQQWQPRMTTFSALAAMTFNPMALIRTRDGIARLSGGLVSTNYFEMLGVSAFLGRTLQSSDDRDRNVIVLSFDTWRRYFHSDPAIIGTPIELRSPDRLMTVVGVMPDNERQLGNLDFYIPLAPESKAGLGPLLG